VPSLVALLEYTAVSAITADTSRLEVANRLESLRLKLPPLPPAHRALVVQTVGDILKSAGWRAPVKFAEQALVAASGAPSTHRLVLADVELWPEPVDGGALLDDLGDTFAGYIKLPAGGAQTLALWVLFAHTHEAYPISPILALVSPERRCAKSSVLRLLSYLVPRPLMTANFTPASLFRAIEKHRPTLLADELETFLNANDDGELRGILNSGHLRDSAVVVRCEGDAHEVRTYSTWAPKACALIGKLPATLEDRAVVLRMRRRRADEAVLPMRADRLGDELRPLAQRAARWAADNLDSLRLYDPLMPAGFRDRLADNWRPLFAVADVAGGGWDSSARLAAQAILGGEVGDGGDDDGSVGALLLADVRAAFTARDADRLTSDELVASLTALEGRPWPEWRAGRPLSTNQLARLLKPFGVKPRVLRVGDRTPRGYERAEFSDVWARYLAPPAAPEAEEGSPFPPETEHNTQHPSSDATIAQSATATTAET
jgi:putative DNA primase/helicase